MEFLSTRQLNYLELSYLLIRKEITMQTSNAYTLCINFVFKDILLNKPFYGLSWPAFLPQRKMIFGLPTKREIQ